MAAKLVLIALLLSPVLGCKMLPRPTGAAPIRAAFYYPWFPEAWSQQGQSPFTNYSPTRGRYATDVGTVRAQIAEMQYARIKVGIASWFGRGSSTDRHWPALIAAARGTGFAWAPYYEPEGVSDPTAQQIADDLHSLRTRFGSGLLSFAGGAMVVFVYNTGDSTQAKGCDTVDRWKQARQLLRDRYRESIYLDLKVFPAYAQCTQAGSIEGWHQYGPASTEQDLARAPGAGSFAISPGYWKWGAAYGAAPFLARDRARWRQSIARMNASGAEWQLITTFNEWGEGTAIEGSSACRMPAPAGALCAWNGPAGSGASAFSADLRAAPPPA